jgi:hypothetical protein
MYTESGSPVVVAIGSNVVTEDDNDSQSHPSVEYLNNSGAVQVFEMPHGTESDTSRVQDGGTG